MDYPYQINSLESYNSQYQKSKENPEKFWSEIAQEFFWQKKWDKVVSWKFDNPEIKWFEGGKLNITENCLDRHLNNHANKKAIIWEPNNPSSPHRSLTYLELYNDVILVAAMLKNNGIQKGDVVCIYLPMIPELTIAILACARIGAIHNVVFGGFSSQALSERIIDSKSKLVITSDGGFRGYKKIHLKKTVDEACHLAPCVKKVIVYKHTHDDVSWNARRDFWWHNELKKIENLKKVEKKAEIMDAEDILFILYTSGSTGKPKGVVHTTAGYMIWANYTFVNVFQYQKGQIFFCTADIGWITGHSYLIYGPLSAGATVLMYEGIPTYPEPNRFWQICEKHQVNILYTAPTVIRTLMCHDLQHTKNNSLESLKILGTVGEPINEEAYHWYDQNIGKSKLPIVDTWWQTETGGIMISPIAGLTPSLPSYATLPLPGVFPEILNENAEQILGNPANGILAIKFPWPGIMRTTFGDHDRFKKTYFSPYPGYFYTGDGCYRNEQGLYRITGRVDDVLNISGHRIGTAEIENAINKAVNVVESAVVGFDHPIKGQAIHAFVICNLDIGYVDVAKLTELKSNIIEQINFSIGAIAKPDKIQLVSSLPKTRSGKIMRRILRKIAEGDFNNLGDISTLIDPKVIDDIITNLSE